MSKHLHLELKEFAPPQADPWGEAYGGRRLGEHIVRSEGFAGHASAYSLFEEMEDKDAHLFSLLQTRKLGVLARRTKLEPAGDTPADRQVAEWVEKTLSAIPSWNGALLHLLDCLGKGLAVAEVLWGFDGEGRIVPRALKPRAAGRFAWAAASGEWRLLEPAGDPLAPGRPLPARKFLVALFGGSDERPYGKGLCEKVYWYWWFKKQNVTERFQESKSPACRFSRRPCSYHHGLP